MRFFIRAIYLKMLYFENKAIFSPVLQLNVNIVAIFVNAEWSFFNPSNFQYNEDNYEMLESFASFLNRIMNINHEPLLQ